MYNVDFCNADTGEVISTYKVTNKKASYPVISEISKYYTIVDITWYNAQVTVYIK